MASMRRRDSITDIATDLLKETVKEEKEKAKVVDYSKKFPIIRTHETASIEENILAKAALKVRH